MNEPYKRPNNSDLHFMVLAKNEQMNLFCLLWKAKKQTKQILLFVFLGESTARQSAFGFIWPLEKRTFSAWFRAENHFELLKSNFKKWFLWKICMSNMFQKEYTPFFQPQDHVFWLRCWVHQRHLQILLHPQRLIWKKKWNY